MKNNQIAFLLLTLFFISLMLSFKVNAQSTSIRIAPAIIEQNLNPGETYSGDLAITNQEEITRILYFIPQNLSSSNLPEQTTFTNEGTPYELASWVRLRQESAVFKPGETKQISFSINAPKNASPGSHLGAIFISFVPPRPKETGVGVGFRTGTIIHIRISGNVFEEMQLREFSTDKLIYSKPEIKFKIEVGNLGNTLLRPKGPIEIIDWFGKNVATILVNPSGAGVLPNSKQEFDVSWKKEGFAFGRYQATITLIYGENVQKTINGVLSFWILPLGLILIIFGSLIFISLILLIFIKLYVRKRLTELRKSLDSGNINNALLNRQPHYKKTAPILNVITIFIGLLIFSLLLLMVLFFFFV